MVEQGNIDLTKRPVVKNKDGSISTVRSMSFSDGRHEILIPTVSDDGRIMSNREAIETYRRSGKHLGKFASVKDATEYAQSLHVAQEQMYSGGNMARKKTVKTSSQLSAKSGPIGGSIPTARSGGLPVATAMSGAANTPMVSAAGSGSHVPLPTAMSGQNMGPNTLPQAANPQLTAHAPAANPHPTAMGGQPQVPAGAPLPNNIDNQQSIASTPAPSPKKKATVKTAKKKPEMVAQATAQPSQNAQFQDKPQPSHAPVFNFHFSSGNSPLNYTPPTVIRE